MHQCESKDNSKAYRLASQAMAALALSLFVNYVVSIVVAEEPIPIDVHIGGTAWYTVFVGGAAILARRLAGGKSVTAAVAYLTVLTLLIMIGLSIVLAMAGGYPVPVYSLVTNLIVVGFIMLCWVVLVRLLWLADSEHGGHRNAG